MTHPGYNGTTNRAVLVGSDGGLYRADDVRTVDATAGWKSLNNGLGITQFYAAAGSPDTGRIIAGRKTTARSSTHRPQAQAPDR